MRRFPLLTLHVSTCAALLIGCQSPFASAPPEPPQSPSQSLSFEISGPSQIDANGVYSWEAFVFGGSGAYEYQWVATSEAGQLITTAAAREFSLQVADTDGDLVLTLTVTSGNERRVESVSVKNCIGGC